jgi:hypothetical protein
MNKVFTDRSRTETYQHCKRERWHLYHDQGMGIRSSRVPLPLAVGGSVHAGLAVLLSEGQKLYSAMPEVFQSLEGTVQLRSLEDFAVKAALEDFAQFGKALEVDTTELAALTMEEQLRKMLGAGDQELAQVMQERVGRAKDEFGDYLFKEQAALVEGMVRAYARRRLRPLLEQYEVLEVEREGQWQLAGGVVCKDCGTRQSSHQREYDQDCQCGGSFHTTPELWFMSRPDALLRERHSNELYILSYKTTGKWDIRKSRDAEHDMQGLSEGVDVEKRLGQHWRAMHDRADGGVSLDDAGAGEVSEATAKYLRDLPAPPRIMGIRYEYMLKGDRWVDKDLSARLETEARTQRSVLVRGYLDSGMTSGDERWNWSWDYHKEDGSTSKLYYKSWRGAAVFDHMPMRQWIDMLDRSTMTVGEESRELGYSGPAQVTGFTDEHPLDLVFVPAIVVYRNDDDLRDWIEQVEAQERTVAEDVARVNAAQDEGERRHLLNVYFSQSRKQCEYPSTCAFVRICYGGEDIRKDPLASGLYQIRIPNHPQEGQGNLETNSQLSKLPSK